MCAHARLHPARFDGAATFCLDCGHQVQVVSLHYLNGKDTRTQAREAWERLQKITEVAPAPCPPFVPLDPSEEAKS